MEKKPATAAADVPSDEYLATIFFYWHDWRKLPEKRRKALVQLAAVWNDRGTDQLAISFRENAWFAFCGEVYALMRCRASFTLDTGGIAIP